MNGRHINTKKIKWTNFERRVAELVNHERIKRGQKRLEIDEDLCTVARKKSKDMALNNYFAHESPKYGTPFDMMDRFGIKYLYAGENLAFGYFTPESVVRDWMRSPGHRANILKPEYTHIGVGYFFSKRSSLRHYWTQEFIGSKR